VGLIGCGVAVFPQWIMRGCKQHGNVAETRRLLLLFLLLGSGQRRLGRHLATSATPGDVSDASSNEQLDLIVLPRSMRVSPVDHFRVNLIRFKFPSLRLRIKWDEVDGGGEEEEEEEARQEMFPKLNDGIIIIIKERERSVLGD